MLLALAAYMIITIIIIIIIIVIIITSGRPESVLHCWSVLAAVPSWSSHVLSCCKLVSRLSEAELKSSALTSGDLVT